MVDATDTVTSIRIERWVVLGSRHVEVDISDGVWLVVAALLKGV